MSEQSSTERAAAAADWHTVRRAALADLRRRLDDVAPDPAARLRVVEAMAAAVEAARLRAVVDARQAGMSWAQVAQTIGAERQRVHARYAAAEHARHVGEAYDGRAFAAVRPEPGDGPARVLWYSATKRAEGPGWLAGGRVYLPARPDATAQDVTTAGGRPRADAGWIDATTGAPAAVEGGRIVSLTDGGAR